MRKIVLIIICVSVFACKKDSDNTNTISSAMSLEAQLEAYPNISLFQEAIAACEDTLNLSFTDITIYAPTNGVLSGFLQDAGADNFTELKNIVGSKFYRAWLGSHIFPSALMLEQMPCAYVPTTAYNPRGQQIHSYSHREKSVLAINGQYLNIITRDLDIPAGILHITDQKMQVPTISKLINANGQSFSILKRALQVTSNSLASLLNREDQMFTIFAPNDAAFDRFFQDLECSDLNGFIEIFGNNALENLLNNHIIRGSHDITSQNGNNLKSLYQGEDLQINLDAGTLKVSNSHGFEANIIQTDITAFNGRIQLIDAVLNLP
jgi:uncharacterized surface protein with fasciclin (FAS1) repeats